MSPLQGTHPYHSLSYTSGDTATDSPVHVGRAGPPVKESPRKESLLSYLTGSFPSLHNLLEGTPQRSSAAAKSSSLTRTGSAWGRGPACTPHTVPFRRTPRTRGRSAGLRHTSEKGCGTLPFVPRWCLHALRSHF